jgi:ribosomal protein S18 acetylase RimI-like enzyme
MLFVDASNRPAVSLYEDIGFTRRRADRAYAWG